MLVFSHTLCLFLSVNDTKGKKKVLGSNQKLKFTPTELILYCKDLRIIRFCFDEAGPESAKKVSDIQFYTNISNVIVAFWKRVLKNIWSVLLRLWTTLGQ